MEREGEALVSIAGRGFRIRRESLDDLETIRADDAGAAPEELRIARQGRPSALTAHGRDVRRARALGVVLALCLTGRMAADAPVAIRRSSATHSSRTRTRPRLQHLTVRSNGCALRASTPQACSPACWTATAAARSGLRSRGPRSPSGAIWRGRSCSRPASGRHPARSACSTSCRSKRRAGTGAGRSIRITSWSACCAGSTGRSGSGPRSTRGPTTAARALAGDRKRVCSGRTRRTRRYGSRATASSRSARMGSLPLRARGRGGGGVLAPLRRRAGASHRSACGRAAARRHGQLVAGVV